MNIVNTKDGIVVEVYVKPKATDFRIMIEDDIVVVFCKEKPTQGKVNKELLKEFSRLFQKKVELVSGFSSKQKKLLIKDVQEAEVKRVLLSK